MSVRDARARWRSTFHAVARRTRWGLTLGLGLGLGLGLAGASCSRDAAPTAASGIGAPTAPAETGAAVAVVSTSPGAPVVLDAAARKRHRLELLIAQIDPVLHGLRLDYRPDGWGWKWPTYLEMALLVELGVEIERRVRELPSLGALDAAVSRYRRETLELAIQLHTIVIGTGRAEAEPGATRPPLPSADVVQPLFERMSSSSHALQAAFRAAPPLPASPAGDRLTLERRCLEATALLVDVPSAITAEAASNERTTAFQLDDLRGRTRACMTAAIDVLDAPGRDHDSADFGIGVGSSLFREIARLRAREVVSWGGNAALSMHYLARRGVTALDAAP